MKTGDTLMGYPIVVADEVPAGVDPSKPVAVFGLFHEWRHGLTGEYYSCSVCGKLLQKDYQRAEPCPGPNVS